MSSKGWKPPTRLQKQAPACLNLDQVAMAAAAATSGPNNATDLKAIPLLSPLVLSPQPLSAGAAEKRRSLAFGEDRQDNIGHDDCNKRVEGEAPAAAAAASPPAPPPNNVDGGWQHPAVPTFTDPSTLLTKFQSQCMIVNQAR